MKIGPNIGKNGLKLSYDFSTERSFRGEPTTNLFIHYGTPGFGSNGDTPVTFLFQGTGTFIRLGYDQVYGGYRIKQSDVVYRYDLGISGCHYHGNQISLSSGVFVTFSFDYYISPETNLENTTLAGIEGINITNYVGGSVKGSWQTISFTMGPTSSSGTINALLYPGGCSPSRLGDKGYVLFKNPQFEIKQYKTPFIQGTRGSTASSGGGIIDLSQNNNNADLVNGPIFTPIGNGSLVFDGTDDYLTLPNDVGYTNEVSVFAWVQIIGNPTGGFHIVFGGQELEISIPTNGELRTGVFTNTRFVSNHGSGLSDGKWHYVGFTFGNSVKTSYIDGISVGTQSTSGTLTSIFNNRTIGRYGSSTQYYLNGRISSTNIYNRILTPSEVLENYDRTKRRYIPENDW